MRVQWYRVKKTYEKPAGSWRSGRAILACSQTMALWSHRARATLGQLNPSEARWASIAAYMAQMSNSRIIVLGNPIQSDCRLCFALNTGDDQRCVNERFIKEHVSRTTLGLCSFLPRKVELQGE